MLRIGDFARLARVTVKTLRFYADAGLFHPAYVDPRSRCRFYLSHQVPALERIRFLRELGCSIAECRELASLPASSREHARGVIALRRRLLVRMALSEQRLRQFDAVLGGYTRPREESRSEIAERRIAAVPALTLRERVRTLGVQVERMFEAAEQRAARDRARAPCNPFFLLHDMEYRAAPSMSKCVCPSCRPRSEPRVAGASLASIGPHACASRATTANPDRAPGISDLGGSLRHLFQRPGASGMIRSQAFHFDPSTGVSA